MFLGNVSEFTQASFGRKVKLTPVEMGDIVQHGYKNRITGGGYGILGHGMTIRDDFSRSKGYTTILENSKGRGMLGRTASVRHIRNTGDENVTDFVPRLDNKKGVRKRMQRTYKVGRGNWNDKRKVRRIQLVEDPQINPSSTKNLPQPTQKKLPQSTTNPSSSNKSRPELPKTTSNSSKRSPQPQKVQTTLPKQPVNNTPPRSASTSATSKPSPKKASKFLNKYSLGALGAAGVLGGGYLGYRAYQKRKNEGKK